MRNYRIVKTGSSEAMEDQIQKLLDTGWHLCGELVVIRERSNAPSLLYIQPVIKHTSDAPVVPSVSGINQSVTIR